MAKNPDVVIIGAGSIGVPAALALAEKGIEVLVIDRHASPGQENNKKAIGGIRATHSDFGKIRVCLRSIEIFSRWQENHGTDIGWLTHGYSFPAYRPQDEAILKRQLEIQQAFGLDISWLSPQEYAELVPGINRENLLGATYSPGDGSASPLEAINAFYFRSLELGARYAFSEQVTGLESANGRVQAVLTDKGRHECGLVINAAGNDARQLGRYLGLDLPVVPDNHEGAISEPVKPFFKPMIVDMRPSEDSLNYYFYQNREGQVVFCITPHPPMVGVDDDSTSLFLPQVARRMVRLYPRLASLKVRRTWRGQYPMTPDGFPIVGRAAAVDNCINAVGMCGQGFMLGPGLGELLARMVNDELGPEDLRVLESFSPERAFRGSEVFK